MKVSGMSAAQPFFSVIVTTMDRPLLLRAAVDSIRVQSWESFEVIIVDDGEMSDELPEMVADPRFIYINKKNFRRGVAASRNIGMQFARGRYIAFLDDDDLMSADFLSWVHDFSKDFPGKAIFGNYDMIQEEVTGAQRVELSRDFHPISGMDISRILISNFIPICAIAIPNLARLPSFDESLPSHEDWDFLLKCLTQLEFVGVDRLACEVRQRSQVGSHRNRSRKEHYWLDFLAVYQRHPSRELAPVRVTAMRSLHGVQIPQEVLENIGRK
jgi:glycosyltransferase involved in cell wall biosynthesis